MIVLLGLIVVGGALFLILSQVKLPKGRRLRGGYGGFGFGGFDGLGALQDGQTGVSMNDGDAPAEQAGQEAADDDDGKVLYIFGTGDREERSLNEDDDQDE